MPPQPHLCQVSHNMDEAPVYYGKLQDLVHIANVCSSGLHSKLAVFPILYNAPAALADSVKASRKSEHVDQENHLL
eukprot:scaffold42999_cov161-Skeletonema_dohrnii-CCMP3373.AAC.1